MGALKPGTIVVGAILLTGALFAFFETGHQKSPTKNVDPLLQDYQQQNASAARKEVDAYIASATRHQTTKLEEQV